MPLRLDVDDDLGFIIKRNTRFTTHTSDLQTFPIRVFPWREKKWYWWTGGWCILKIDGRALLLFLFLITQIFMGGENRFYAIFRVISDNFPPINKYCRHMVRSKMHCWLSILRGNKYFSKLWYSTWGNNVLYKHGGWSPSVVDYLAAKQIACYALVNSHGNITLIFIRSQFYPQQKTSCDCDGK